MYSLISVILVLTGVLCENVPVLFVAALFAFASNVEIHINIDKGINRMMAKLQEGYYFLLVLLDAVGMTWARTKRTLRDLLDILIALAGLLFDSRTLKNKLYALLLISCTLPVMFLEGDATATVFVGFIAVPMFFAKESWVY